MRKKLISKTYLKDVYKYTLNIYFDNNDYYLSIKKIIDIKEPFIVDENLFLIDNNYYIVEVIPKNTNYTMRIFLNEKKEKLLYYFDITLSNGIDKETKIPYYDDLFLDVTVKDKKIKILDEDELQEALNKKEISNDDFILANKTKDLLVESIENNTNKYINLNFDDYLI